MTPTKAQTLTGWDDADFSDPVVEDDGEPVSLFNESPFYGIYQGVKDLVTNKTPGNPRPFKLYLFTDRTNQRRSIGGNYQLDKAFAPTTNKVAIGDRVKIEYHGKKELDGGQTMNRISVFVAKGSEGVTFGKAESADTPF